MKPLYVFLDHDNIGFFDRSSNRLAEIDNKEEFVKWFRHSSPYINAHRGKTFVILFDGDAVEDPDFPNLVHDIALLNSLGIRLVLVHGARFQIEQSLNAAGLNSQIVNHTRVTDEASLHIVKQSIGVVKMQVEAMLSMGVANSPMAGAKIRVVSGNFVTAKPVGVQGGIDFCFTGNVRRIDTNSIEKHLNDESIVLLSSIGYSPTGEIFSLTAEEVATQTAVALKADKLIYLCNNNSITDTNDQPIAQLTLNEAKQWLNQHNKSIDWQTSHSMQSAIEVCSKGVKRAHIVDRHISGALLLELFSRNGIGTLISGDTYDTTRQATIDDIGGILELIEPLESDGILVRRSRERLEMEVTSFTVVERDGMIIGCAALYMYKNENIAELACLAIDSDYRNEKRGDFLLQGLEANASKQGIKKLFVLTAKTAHWFIERGFAEAKIDDLPLDKQKMYNYQRRSKVFIKQLH